LNSIQVFSNKELDIQVRTVLNEDGSISINAEDAAIGFGWYEEKDDKLYPRWRTINSYLREFGFSQDVAKDDFIPESLFYLLGMKASNERALKYQKWLAMDVLPAIRKHGIFAIDELINNPDLAIKAFTALKEEKEKNKTLTEEVNLKNQLIGELKPKADYLDKILNSHDLMTMTQIAKDYGMSAQRMNELLHNLKVQYKQSDQWFLYSNYHEFGYTQSHTSSFPKPDGTVGTKLNTKWTQKGRIFLYNLLKGNGYLPTIEKEDLAKGA
jgi:phage antirepressor YoqD-like protein